MKLDIHVHTKKVKSGDATTRNIEKDRFVDILKDTDVKILAITNHNHFDLTQITQLKFFEISLWGNPKFRRTIFCVFW